MVAVHLGAELGGGGGGGGEADHVAAGGCPGPGQGVHGGRLAGPGGRDRQLHPCPRAGHFADQQHLAGVEPDPVRLGFKQRQIDRGWVGDHPSTPSGGIDQPLFGGQDAAGGEQLSAGDGVHTVAAGAPQRLGFTDRVLASGDRDAARDRGGDEVVDPPSGVL